MRRCSSSPPGVACSAAAWLAAAALLSLGGCREDVAPPVGGDDDAASDDDSAPGPDPGCEDGEVRECATACGDGVEVCAGGRWGPCSAPAPLPESCNGLDDDCDGAPDDGLWQWRLEPVDHVATSHPTSLALLPDGRPVVAYLDGAVGSEADQVKLALRVGEGWQAEVIAGFQEAFPGNATVALAVDAAGALHVAWARLDYATPGGGGTSPGGLHYLTSPAPGEPWQAEEVVHDGVAGDSLSLAADAVGDVHACYQRGSSELWYARRAQGGWSTEYVAGGDPFGDDLAGADCSIAVDASGTPSITYARHSFLSDEDFELRRATRDGAGWLVEVVDTDTPVGAHSSLELDGDGRPRVSYRTYDPLIDVRYAEHDGDSWRIETVDGPGDVGGYTSLAVDAAGTPHVAYFDWTEEVLRHAARTGAGWEVRVVDPGPDTGRHASLAADAEGGLHVTYDDESRDELRYAQWTCCPEGGCAPGPWSPVSDDGAPSARRDHTAVWTGDELVIWGGNEGSASLVLGTGGAWDREADAWRALESAGAPAARDGHAAVWTGVEVVVWGGREGSTPFGDGARYDPAADAWRPMASEGAPTPRWGHAAVWTGTEMLVWGGSDGASYLASGARYDPSLDVWTPLGEDGAPSARSGAVAAWTGDEMIVWGGFDGDVLGDGARYHAALDEWKALRSEGAPSARSLAAGVWTGSELVVWGGWDGWDATDEHELGSGARYDPSTDAWTATADWGAPSARYGHAAAWTGTGMAVWGGRDDRVTETGALYDPASDTWSPLTLRDAPAPREAHTITWTGSELVVWGGADGWMTATGGRWRP